MRGLGTPPRFRCVGCLLVRGGGGVRGVRQMKATFLRKKKPLFIPEPRQRVRLRTARGRWRGSFRAVSEPYTDEEAGVVVVRVAKESEYQNAIREGRSAVGMAWPVRLIEVVFSPLEEERPQEELPRGLQEKLERAKQQPRPSTGEAQEPVEKRRSWWQRMLGG